jgi:hypothetical protein
VKVLAVGVLFVLAAACGVQQSGLDPNASVTISGKALGADGKPLANTKVVLIKELDLGEFVGGLFITAASLGLACIADHPPALCSQNAHTATTDSGGAYSFSVKGRDTQGSFGVASTIEVITRSPAASNGPNALMEFNVQTSSLSLPDLRLWDPPISWSSQDRPTWQPLPDAYGSSPAYSVELYDLRENQWWVAASARSGDKLDSRILEDLNGNFDVAARAHGTANGTTVDYTYISGSQHVRGHAGAPPSRGAPCALVTSSGVGAFDSSCWLTKGTLGGSTAPAGGATGVVIDLGQDRPLSFVVVKGCSVQCKVALSSDLTSWSEAGTISGPYATAPITLNRSARYVRISGASSGFGLRQVSVW